MSAIFGFLLLYTTMTLASSTFHAPADFDVVVVGAGLSGLWAARELEKYSNLSVVVLEARSRVGGRTESHAPGTDDSFDFGAHWVGTSQYHILDVIKQLGKETYRQYITGTKVLEIDGKVSHYRSTIPSLPIMQEINFGLLYAEVNSMLKHVPREAAYNYSKARHYDGMTVESFCTGFPWKTETAQLIAASFRTIFAKEIGEVSALEFLHYAACAGGVTPLLDASPGGGQEFKIIGGTQALSLALAERLDVRLNTTVVAIEVKGTGASSRISVKSLDGRTFSARRAIVALPPHLAASIWYSPVLPAKKSHLLSRMTQGHLIKTIITYSKAFWRSNGFSGEVVSSAPPISICYDDTTPKGTAALVCFVGGRDAVKLSPLSKEDRKQAVVTALVRYFGEDARNVSAYLERDWGTEEFTGGCPVGSMNAGAITQWGDALREPHGPVHFGGTETATWWYGFMNGAVQAGERCAMEILGSFHLNVPQEMKDFYNMGGISDESEDLKRSPPPIFA
mmetsp:Transcript_25951/g.41717  ORF Transcript_25951/g.41717 Transcript_25951/m.41717 type:complete len:509 (-) Transcript_25951:154-1680(-)